MISGKIKDYVTLEQLGVDSGFGTPLDPVLINIQQDIADGILVNQATKLYRAKPTIAAATNLDLDLNGALLDFQSNVINFTRIVGLWVYVNSDVVGSDIRVGGVTPNPANPWAAVPGAVGPIGPRGLFKLWNPSAAAFAVVAGTGDILRIRNNGAAALEVWIIILGS